MNAGQDRRAVHSDESRESTVLLQRVSRFGLFGSFIVLGFLLYRALVVVLAGKPYFLVHPSFTACST